MRASAVAFASDAANSATVAPPAETRSAAKPRTATQAQASTENKLLRSSGAQPRTTIDEPIGVGAESQYFFVHDDNYFSVQAVGPERPRMKFQFSVRFDVVSLGDDNNVGLNVAFTQKSFWDMLDFKHSSPFIESNYKPEAFFSYRPSRSQRFREIQLGVQHESNGLGEVGAVNQTPDTRGWNYVFLDGRWGLARGTAAGEPWFFLTPGLRLWVPFAYSPRNLVDVEGYFLAYVDIDVRIPQLPTASRISARVKVRRHSVEGDVYYPLLALTTGGAVRAWIFGQIFKGEAERLITFGDDVTHVYFGIGFQ